MLWDPSVPLWSVWGAGTLGAEASSPQPLGCACECANELMSVCTWEHSCTCMHTHVCACVQRLALSSHGLQKHQAPLFLELRVTVPHVCFSGNVRISDLGLAVELKEGQTKTKGYAGTPGKGLRARMRVAFLRGGVSPQGFCGVPMARGRWHGEGWEFVGKRLPHPQSKDWNRKDWLGGQHSCARSLPLLQV